WRPWSWTFQPRPVRLARHLRRQREQARRHQPGRLNRRPRPTQLRGPLMTIRRITNGDGATHMPTRSLAEVIDALKTDLTDLDEYGQEIAEAEVMADELAAKRKELIAVEAETARTQAAWDKAKQGLTQAQFDTLHNWDQKIFAAGAELAELQAA